MGKEHSLIGYCNMTKGRLLFSYREPIHIDVPCDFIVQETKFKDRYVLLVKPTQVKDERQQEIRFS